MHESGLANKPFASPRLNNSNRFLMCVVKQKKMQSSSNWQPHQQTSIPRDPFVEITEGRIRYRRLAQVFVLAVVIFIIIIYASNANIPKCEWVCVDHCPVTTLSPTHYLGGNQSITSSGHPKV